MTIGWNFPDNNNGEISGISEAGIETFKGSPFSSLAREICQNSLDARENYKKPVQVDFQIYDAPTKAIDKFDELYHALREAKTFWSKNEKASKFLKRAVDVAGKETIRVLRISDYNTLGLTGSREKFDTPWQNLVKSSGVSNKGGASGGSFGIGKSAPFACSDIRTVIYSTLDKDGLEASQGVSRLVSFEHKKGLLSEKYTTQGIGYYGNADDNSALRTQYTFGKFKRKKPGTDLYVLGFRRNGDWENEITQAVLEGFLISIMNKDLVVKVGTKEINDKTLPELIEAYKDDCVLAYNYYQVLTSSESCCVTENFNGIGNITLRILFKNDLKRKVLISRSNGMKIFDKQNISSTIFFAGVLTLDGEDINTYFKRMETPQHDNWQPERLDTSEEVSKAKKDLKTLYKWIKDTIIKYGSLSVSDEVDIKGMGDFIPDELQSDESSGKNQDEDIANNISDIDVKEVKVKDVKFGAQHTDEISTAGEIEAPGFYDEDIDADDADGTANIPRGDRNSADGGEGLPAPGTESQDSLYNIHKTVSIEPIYTRLFVSDYSQNEYTLIMVPSESADNCYVKLSIIGEQSKIKLSVISAYSEKQCVLNVKNSKILLGKINKNVRFSLKFKTDYSSICSMEADLYGNKI